MPLIEPEDELIAFIDGEASPSDAERIRTNPALRATADGYARTQRALVNYLYRFDCPTSQMLGEYELGLLSPAERTRIAAHITTCPNCLPEIQMLREFLADEREPAPSSLARLRRVVADLLPAPTALAGVRGAATEGGQTYRAGAITVALDAMMTRGMCTLTGLLWREDPDASATPDATEIPTAGAFIALRTGEALIQTTTLDELGNFAFDDLAPGMYTVEVTLGDDQITLEGVRIGI